MTKPKAKKHSKSYKAWGLKGFYGFLDTFYRTKKLAVKAEEIRIFKYRVVRVKITEI